MCAADRSIKPADNFIEMPNAKFDKHVSRDSPDPETLKKIRKGDVAGVT